MARSEPDRPPWALIEHSQDIITVLDEHGKITYVNPAVELVLGYQPAELLGTNAFDLIHPEDRDEIWQRFVNLIEQIEGATERVQHRMEHNSGRWIWVESIGSNRQDSDLHGYVLNSRDITEIKERERNLEEYMEFTESIFDSIEDGFFIMDGSAAMLRWNRTVTEQTGYTDAEVESMTAADFVPEEQYGVIAENLQEAIETGNARFEADLQAKDGGRTPYEFTTSRLETPEGETVFAGIGRDISERKRREQELRRFRSAIEASGHAIYLTDIDGRIEYVNHAFEETTGYPAEEALGSNPRILKSGEMAGEYFGDLWTTILAGGMWEEELVNRRNDGELYTARQTIAPIRDGSGEIDGFVAIQTDITAEKERIETLEIYRQAIESSNELVAAADRDYRFLFANRRYLEYHGVDRDSLEQTRVDEALTIEDWQVAKPYVDRALAGERVRYQMDRSSDQGREQFMDIEYTPLHEGESDEIIGVLATIRDITDIRERQRQLIVIGRILRHNLHNDMNVIRGHVELIHDASTGDIAASAETALTESDRLLKTVDKTKDVTDLFAEDHHLKATDLRGLLELLVEEQKRQHPTVTFVLDFDDVEPVRASEQIGQGLRELLQNAAEHNDSETPEVAVTADVTETSVGIEISDNGPGIPEMERRVLTEEDFEQPLYHGSGLGLWLVYWVVQRSGGELIFREHEPRGSVVRIELPRV